MRRVLVILLVLVFFAGGAFVWIRGEGAAPVITAPEGVDLGRNPLALEVRAEDAGSGVRQLVAKLRTADGERELGVLDVPGGLLRGGSDPRGPATLALALDAKALGLKEGDAFVVVAARDWSLRNLLKGNTATLEIPVRVDLRPPRVAIANGITYLRRSGSGAAYYSVTEDAVKDGVQVGEHFYRGFPRKGFAATDRVALFAIARDQTPDVSIQVVAEDRAGNRAAAGWSTELKDTVFPEEPIELDRIPVIFNERVPDLAGGFGWDAEDRVATFQRINSEGRALNEARIREIVREPTGERLFDGPFLQMRNSMVTSRFAEHRTYTLKGEKISEAIHYGFDLAVTKGAPVEAANRGKRAVRGRARHLRQLRDPRSRARPHFAVRAPRADRRRAGPARREGRAARALGAHRPRGRRPPALRHLGGRHVCRPGRVVGREVGAREDRRDGRPAAGSEPGGRAGAARGRGTVTSAAKTAMRASEPRGAIERESPVRL